MKRYKTKETEPGSTNLNWVPEHKAHKVFSPLKMSTEGGKDISTYIEDIYTYICMHKPLNSALDKAFGKRLFALTIAQAMKEHSGFHAIFHAMLANHNTARKKKTKPKQQKKTHSICHVQSPSYFS